MCGGPVEFQHGRNRRREDKNGVLGNVSRRVLVPRGTASHGLTASSNEAGAGDTTVENKEHHKTPRTPRNSLVPDIVKQDLIHSAEERDERVKLLATISSLLCAKSAMLLRPSKIACECTMRKLRRRISILLQRVAPLLISLRRRISPLKAASDAGQTQRGTIASDATCVGSVIEPVWKRRKLAQRLTYAAVENQFKTAPTHIAGHGKGTTFAAQTSFARHTRRRNRHDIVACVQFADAQPRN